MRPLLLAMGLTACHGAAPSDDADTAGGPAHTDAPLPRRMLVIGVDGLRPDALVSADTPNLDAAFARGVLDLASSTQLTGITLSGPGWTSILTGVEVEDHGVTDNDTLLARDPAWPTFPERLRDAGRATAAAIHWAGVGVIAGPDAFDRLDVLDTDAGVGTAGEALVAGGAHELVFLHFDDVDAAGHATGFSADNPAYVDAIEAVDHAVGPVLDAVAARSGERWLVVLCTDHAGVGTSHGSPIPAMQTIPQAMWGAPVALPARGGSQLDVAPTALAWLGVAAEGLDGVSWLR